MQLLLLNLIDHVVEKHQFKDEVMELIEKLERFPKPDSKLCVLEVPMGDQLDEARIEKWLKTNSREEFDGLTEEFESLQKEITKQVAETKELYLSKISDMALQYYSIKQLVGLVNLSMLRLRRLALILEPDYSLTKGTHTRSKIEYEMIRAYWYEDNGEKKRTFNKNVGSSQMGLEDVASKMFESLGYETLQQTNSNASKRLFDLIITKGGRKWIVEIKQHDKRKLIDTYVSMELWKKYKTTYGLL